MEINRICVAFDVSREDTSTEDYLKEMVLRIKYGDSCPKTGQPMELLYPNRDNLKLFNSLDKLKAYRLASPKKTSYWASHLLEGRKFYLVWSHD